METEFMRLCNTPAGMYLEALPAPTRQRRSLAHSAALRENLFNRKSKTVNTAPVFAS